MANRVCPVWIGYFLLNPVRKWLENPEKMLQPHIREGMTVLEPGCGMGYFTLPMARMVGSGGRVIAVDIQEKMLAAMMRRAAKKGLDNRIATRLAGDSGMDLSDFRSQVDFAAAIHVVHEIPDQKRFFTEVHDALRAGGKLLVVEPKGHVKEGPFRQTMDAAQQAGFEPDSAESDIGRRMCLLHRFETSTAP